MKVNKAVFNICIVGSSSSLPRPGKILLTLPHHPHLPPASPAIVLGKPWVNTARGCSPSVMLILQDWGRIYQSFLFWSIERLTLEEFVGLTDIRVAEPPSQQTTCSLTSSWCQASPVKHSCPLSPQEKVRRERN